MLTYSKIYSQQALNKKWLLKRKGKRQLHSDLAFSFRIRLLGDMLLLRDCLGYIPLYIILLSSKFNSSTFLWLSVSPPEYGTANYTNGICYFDEMMKAYINIKNNSGLHPHQTLNKRIGLMKREHGHSLTHRFSFDERFDERMLSAYRCGFQYIKLPIHQFIGFSLLIKSAAETVASSLPVCPCTDMQSCRHSCKGYHTRLAKRERQRQASDTIAGFWEAKSHSSLGRFLHAPLTLLLKTPQ